jgi:cytochrome c oxidase assembly factor CtaG
MSDAVQDIVRDWRLPVWLTLAIALPGAVYLRGWLAIRHTRPRQFTALRLASFQSGLFVLWLSIASPMDGFADALLSAHMVEHLLLMSVVPPLLLFGWPTVPMLRGLTWRRRRRHPQQGNLISPLIRSPLLRRILHWLVTPAVAWLAMNLTFLAWHIPTAYDFALEHEGWHAVEHLCFLGTSILFWWCIILPWPTKARPLNWSIVLYLISADIVNTLLSAFLTFIDHPVYRYYVDHPGPFHTSPLEDQSLGAVIMWVVGSIFFLVPGVLLSVHLLQPQNRSIEDADWS